MHRPVPFADPGGVVLGDDDVNASFVRSPGPSGPGKAEGT